MTTDPVEHRIERIRDRMEEITHQLAGLDEQAGTETEDAAEQAELVAKATELREEHQLLDERLAGLLQDAHISGDPDLGDDGAG